MHGRFPVAQSSIAPAAVGATIPSPKPDTAPSGAPTQGAQTPNRVPSQIPLVLRPPVSIHSLTPAERQRLVNLWLEFGPKMVAMHTQWHEANGAGGTQGPGSGEKFMQFHANLMKDFAALVAKKAPALWFDKLKQSLPAWNPASAIPKEFQFADMIGSSKGPKGIDWPIPAYLTNAAKPGQDLTLFLEDNTPVIVGSLKDIKDVDLLGRVLGLSGAHAVGHVRSGGAMSGFASVGVPFFLLWHGSVMEGIRRNWLASTTGAAEAKRFPPEGFHDNRANGHMPAKAAAAARELATLRGETPGFFEEPSSHEVHGSEATQPMTEDAFRAELAELAAKQEAKHAPLVIEER